MKQNNKPPNHSNRNQIDKTNIQGNHIKITQRQSQNLSQETTSNQNIKQSMDGSIIQGNHITITQQVIIPPTPDKIIKNYVNIPLTNHYQARQNLTISQQDPVQILSGPSGIGKSTLARYYAQQQDSIFHNSFWIDCGNPHKDIQHQLCDFYITQKSLSPEKLDEAQIKHYADQFNQWVATTPNTNLFIFDNAQDMVTIQKQFPFINAIQSTHNTQSTTSQIQKTQILVTTKSPSNVFADFIQHIKIVPDFSPQEAQEYITQRLTKQSKSFDISAVQQLIAIIPLSPLLLNSVAGYIVTRAEMTIPKYIDLFKEIKKTFQKDKKTKKLNSKILDRDNSIYSQEADAIAIIKLPYNQLSLYAKELLHILSLVYP